MFKTILIDDEQHCLQSLDYLLGNHFPEIEVSARCSDGEEALAALQVHRPDLVFMDIEMPLLNGFQVLERLGTPRFSIIFTTAYSRYAVRAFRFSALDFLLKPIDPAEFVEAVNRVKQSVGQNHSEKQLGLLQQQQKDRLEGLTMIALPSMEGLHFVDTGHIQYCESDGNYTKIHLKETKPIVISRPLKEMEQILEGRSFFRIHKQFLINLLHIRRYLRGDGGSVEVSNGSILPVARNRKETFLQIFSR